MDFRLRTHNAEPDVLVIAETFCADVNRGDTLFGPNEKQLDELKRQLGDAEVKSVSPLEYMESVRTNLRNILANMFIEDANLAKMMPKIHLDEFSSGIPHGDKVDILTLIVKNRDDFLDQVARENRMDIKDLQKMVDEGKYPVENDFPVSGVFAKRNGEGIMSLRYYYVKEEKEQSPEHEEFMAKYKFKVICEEAEKLAKKYVRQQEEAEEDRYAR